MRKMGSKIIRHDRNFSLLGTTNLGWTAVHTADSPTSGEHLICQKTAAPGQVLVLRNAAITLLMNSVGPAAITAGSYRFYKENADGLTHELLLEIPANALDTLANQKAKEVPPWAIRYAVISGKWGQRLAVYYNAGIALDFNEATNYIGVDVTQLDGVGSDEFIKGEAPIGS